MIQRPQSILLFLAAILYSVMAFAPLWSLTILTSTVELDATSAILVNNVGGEIIEQKTATNIYLLAGCATGVVLSIVTIFLFKNRNLQSKLTLVNTLIIIVFIGLTVLLALPAAKNLIMSKEAGTVEWGFFVSIGIIICNFGASKLIRKDEALIKSVDRIR